MIILVEGNGDKRAVPLLLNRYGCPSPTRVIDMKGKSNIVRSPHGFEDTIRRELAAGHRAFVVLVDGDVACAPYESLQKEKEGLDSRARSLEMAHAITVNVFWAVVEFESWLIGGIHPSAQYCSLRRTQRIPSNTQVSPADPKVWLRSCLADEYEPRIAECLATKIDLALACQRNESMRDFLAMMAKLMDPTRHT